MRVLLLGSGGREHALARALAADPAVTGVHAAPGNPGIAAIATVHPADLADIGAMLGLARSVAPDLVVIGPEAPLVAGLADALRGSGLSCFGPSRRAAMIEGSKSFAKEVMRAASIPTARARTCTSEAEVAGALAEFGPPYVVKADGLAAGEEASLVDMALHLRLRGAAVCPGDGMRVCGDRARRFCAEALAREWDFAAGWLAARTNSRSSSTPAATGRARSPGTGSSRAPA